MDVVAKEEATWRAGRSGLVFIRCLQVTCKSGVGVTHLLCGITTADSMLKKHVGECFTEFSQPLLQP